MPDNVELQSAVLATPPAGTKIATRSVTYSGDAAELIAPVGLVQLDGADDAKTATDVPIYSIIGAVDEAAPASDTASSGLNGRLQRAAQRLTSLITALTDGSARVGGTVAVSGPLTDAQLRATAVPVSLAAAPSTVVTNAGTFAVQNTAATPAGTNTIGGVTGALAHDDANTSANKPAVAGREAITYNTSPTAVAGGDVSKGYCDLHGIPFVLGGHPNIQTFEAAYTAAQTDTAIITVAGGFRAVVTQIQIVTDAANTVPVSIRVGFGTTTTPTTAGVLATHPGLVPGAGLSRGDGSGVLGSGADGADIRVTCSVPTGGSVRVLLSYYGVEV